MSQMLYTQITEVNRTLGYGYHATGVIPAHTDSPGELYRQCRSEYGRCIGKCYLDVEGGTAQQVGWVFLKRSQYEDSPETYLQETWVTVHEQPPVTTVTNHYYNLGGV